MDSEYTRNQILDALELQLATEGGGNQPSAPDQDLDDAVPSAPEDAAEPSAPPSNIIETFQTGECVVCLENKVSYIVKYITSLKIYFYAPRIKSYLIPEIHE